MTLVLFPGQLTDTLARLLKNQETLMAQLSEVLAAVADVDASVKALVARIPAPVPVVDLQPAVDALAAVKASLDAIDPAAPAA